MPTDRRRFMLAATGISALARPAAAHHGWGGYDAGTVLTLTGPVREVYFGNPHCSVVVEAEGKPWTCVLAPLSRMTNRGLPDGSIKVGDSVTLVGYPHRNEVSELRAERIVVAGRTVELR